MTKIYLIHGWGGNPNSEAWFPWLKKELAERNIKLEIPEMPDTENPKIKSWVDKLKKIVELDEQTYLIGHSIGCQAILRFLEKLPENIKLAGCIFVAGWFNLQGLSEEERKIAKPWTETSIGFDKIKEHANNFLVIFSDNDPYIPLSDSKIFKEKLNAKIIIKHGEGHFNETKEIKEIIGFIK